MEYSNLLFDHSEKEKLWIFETMILGSLSFGDFRYLPVVTTKGYSGAMRKLSLLLSFCAFSIAMLLPAFGQVPAATAKPKPKMDNEFVQQQFGDQFTLIPEIGASFGDLDGNGVEDIAIAARCKNPMLDQGEHKYTVIDPYDEFFGYGNPNVTTTFSEGNPALRGLVILIIEGANKDGWRSPTPKAKFVIVNLPYKTISIRKMQLKKKTVEAIYVEEAGNVGSGTSSAVFFDGKKFRYVPMGGNME